MPYRAITQKNFKLSRIFLFLYQTGQINKQQGRQIFKKYLKAIQYEGSNSKKIYSFFNLLIKLKSSLFFQILFQRWNYNINQSTRITMSSIGFARMSADSLEQMPDVVNQSDDAQFFSVAQEYNERKLKMMNQRAMQSMNMFHNFNIKNNPKDPKASQAKQQKTRKTRNDKQGRQYTCGGCKLSYLSYPALYTHIKTKHNGIAPEGTIRGKNNNNKRRGRPKNIRAQPNLHHRPEPEFIFPEIYCRLVDKYDLTFIQAEQYQRNEQQDIKIQSEIFSEQVKQLKNSTLPLITLPIIKVITIYLQNIKDFVAHRSDVLQTVEAISERLVKFINNNYFKILKQFQNGSNYYIRQEIPENQVYCDYEKCDYVPVFVSSLFKRLDSQNDQMEVDFLIDFCLWLNRKKLTHIKLLKPEVLEAGTGMAQQQ